MVTFRFNSEVSNDTFVMPLMSLAFSLATFWRWSSINCCFFGRNAKCFNPRDSGVDELHKSLVANKILRYNVRPRCGVLLKHRTRFSDSFDMKSMLLLFSLKRNNLHCYPTFRYAALAIQFCNYWYTEVTASCQINQVKRFHFVLYNFSKLLHFQNNANRT